MRPEMSLVLLTVLAGAGQGLFIMLVVLDALSPAGMVPPALFYSAGAVALILPSIGMVASFFHLGNPSRGWKAALMWKTSWLSREVVFLPLFMGFAFLYLLLYHLHVAPMQRFFIGLLGIGAAFGLYISSAMLYAAIRFVREWANAYTTVNFIFFGLASGSAVFLAVAGFVSPSLPTLNPLNHAFILLAGFSLVLKALAFKHNAAIYSTLTPRQALGVSDARVKMMDMGTAYAHFNTKEFYVPLSRKDAPSRQMLVLITAFFIPLSLGIVNASGIAPALFAPVSALSAIIMLGGLVLERRLFFMQGNHLQNLYYGNYHLNRTKNPIASKARSGVPLPK